MSEPTKKEPTASKDPASEGHSEASRTFTISNAAALDQINISIKFRSRDHDVIEAKGVKPNVDFASNVGQGVKTNMDLHAPVQGGTENQNYVTREQFDELKEQVRRLIQQIKGASKGG